MLTRKRGKRSATALVSFWLPALLVVAPLAFAAGDRDVGDADSFSGSCHFAGTLSFVPPLKTEFQVVHTVASAQGPCDGTFTDQKGRTRALNGEPVRYAVDATGQISCGPGGQNTGTGYMQFGREKLYFAFSEVREAGSATLTLTGLNGGSATGQGTVSPDEDPVDLAAKCAGAGLAQVRVTIDIVAPSSISG